MRILIVEDEERLARHISRALARAGHDAPMVRDGAVALREAQRGEFDLILLDLMLPGLDGLEVLRRLRKAHVPSPVLILSARGDINARANGRATGADDYLAKPFAMPELIARVHALLRRGTEKKAPINLQVADLSLDLTTNELRRGERRIELSAREITLLRVLMREPGRVFSRTELCARVWEREHEYDMKLVEVFVSRLRRKIDLPQLIHTVRHLGYTIAEPPC